MKRFAMLQALAVAALAVALAGSTPAADEGPDFDEAVKSGSQIVKNGSFEDTVEGGQPVKNWQIAPPLVKALTVKTDSPHHGKQYLSYDIGETRYMYFFTGQVEQGKINASAWVRGNGRVQLGCWYEMKDYKNRGIDRLMKRSLSKPMAVKSDDWTLLEYTFAMPEEVLVEGKPEKPERLCFQIGISGRIDIDEVVIAPGKAAGFKPK